MTERPLARRHDRGTTELQTRPLKDAAPTEEEPVTLADDILSELTVRPGTSANLATRDPAWKGNEFFKDLATDELKALARTRLQHYVDELTEAQRLLYASDTHSMLLIFQALDA